MAPGREGGGEESLLRRAHRERLKELAALHDTARFLRDPSLTTSDLLERVARRLPDAMLHAEDAEARAHHGDVARATPGFEPGGRMLVRAFSTGDGRGGAIEVVYRNQGHAEAAEGPFLAEERALVDSVAEMLQAELDRRATSLAMRRRETETALALASADLAIWEWSVRDDVTTWSPELQRMLQREARTGGIGANSDAIHPEDRERVLVAARRALESPEHPIEVDFRGLRGDGSIIWVQARGRVLCDADGRPDRVIGVFADVTRRKVLEESMAHLEKMEALGRVAAGVAHDFNNLLMVVSLNASELQDSLAEADPLQASISGIQEASRRGMALTWELLTFGRRAAAHPEPVSPAELIRASEVVLRRLLGPEVELSLRLREVGRVLGDATHLDRVVMNLVVNARDAMDGRGTVTIETALEEVPLEVSRLHADVKPGPHVVIAVSDTGSGMDAATRSRIFEPFFTTKEPGKGTGLGLAVVFGLVQQCRGFVQVESEVGRGSQFRIYLPRAD